MSEIDDAMRAYRRAYGARNNGGPNARRDFYDAAVHAAIIMLHAQQPTEVWLDRQGRAWKETDQGLVYWYKTRWVDGPQGWYSIEKVKTYLGPIRLATRADLEERRIID